MTAPPTLRAVALAVAFVGATLPARGQAAPSASSDDAVREALVLAVQNLGRLTCEGTTPCAPATREELSSPPVTMGDARAAFQRGLISGAAQVCGLDWMRRSYLPLMRAFRAGGRNDRQTAILGAVHGISQGRAARALGAQPCDQELRQKLEARLPSRS